MTKQMSLAEIAKNAEGEICELVKRTQNTKGDVSHGASEIMEKGHLFFKNDQNGLGIRRERVYPGFEKL
jgi:hypothetical protein